MIFPRSRISARSVFSIGEHAGWGRNRRSDIATQVRTTRIGKSDLPCDTGRQDPLQTTIRFGECQGGDKKHRVRGRIRCFLKDAKRLTKGSKRSGQELIFRSGPLLVQDEVRYVPPPREKLEPRHSCRGSARHQGRAPLSVSQYQGTFALPPIPRAQNHDPQREQ